MFRVVGDLTLSAQGTDDARVRHAVWLTAASYFRADLIDSSAWTKLSRQLEAMGDDSLLPDGQDPESVEDSLEPRQLAAGYDYHVHYQAFVHVQQEDAVRQAVANLDASTAALAEIERLSQMLSLAYAQQQEDGVKQAMARLTEAQKQAAVALVAFDQFAQTLRQVLLPTVEDQALFNQSFVLVQLPGPLLDQVSLTHISTSTTSGTTTTSTSTETITSSTTSSNSSTSTSSSTTTGTSSLTTSTSTSSWTSTSTSSTSTTVSTTFDLRLLSAELRQNFTTILLTFNAPAILVGQVAYEPLVRCGEVFTVSTMRRLGFLPECTWLADGKHLQVALGSDASGEAEMIQPGDFVETLVGVLTVNRFVVSLPAGPTPSLKGSVFTKDAPVLPRAHLSVSPPFSQSCGRISVSASRSTGNAGRSMSVQWQFGPRSTLGFAEELGKHLSRANSTSALSFVINPENLSRAVKAYRAKQATMPDNSSRAAPLLLEFMVTVRNWFGLSDVAFAMVEVSTAEDPVPLVAPTSATALKVNRDEAVEFGIETSFVDRSRCASLEKSPADTGLANMTPVYTVVISWEYRQIDSPNFSNWTQLEAVPHLRDLARRPVTVRFAPFSFESGSQHQFRVTAGYDISAVTAQRPTYMFNLTVALAPPVAVLSGPTEASTACSFELDAGASRDPGLPPGVPTDFVYTWSCQGLTHVATDCTTGIMGYLLRFAGVTMPVPPGMLQPGSYSFTVQVARRSGGSSSSATIITNLTQFADPPVMLVVPWSNSRAVSTQTGGQLGVALAQVQGSSSCPVEDTWAWQWVLVEEEAPSPMVAVLDTGLVRRNGSNHVNLTTSDFRGSFMTPGKLHAYALLMTKTQVDMTAILASGPQHLDSYIERGASVKRTVPFLADAPPVAGTVGSQPMYGYTVQSAFTIYTQGWYDEDAAGLTFAFYRFPLPSSIKLAENGGNSTEARGTIQPLSIDWDNVSSPRYWWNLGGRLLRSFMPSPMLLDIAMPAGSYLIVTRAKDRMGALGTAILFGPTVVNPPGGLDLDETANYLTSALISSDANDILNAVGAVAPAPLANQSPQRQAQLTDQLLDALESATSVLEPDGVQKIGSALTSVMRSSTAAGPNHAAVAADRALKLVDSVLSVVMSGESGGMDPAAGESLLDNINTMGAAFEEARTSSAPDDNPSTSNNEGEAAARTEKLQSLVSRLCGAVMNRLPLRSTQSLSSVDASGRGSEITLKKDPLEESVSEGLSAPGLSVPGSALSVRRLQAASTSNPNFQLRPLNSGQAVSNDSCSYVGVQLTEWLSSNPYAWADGTVGLASVARNATVKVLELTKCGSTLSLAGQAAPLSIDLTLPPAPGDPSFVQHFKPMCVRFNTTNQRWTSNGLAIGSNTTTTLKCLSSMGGGTYTAIFQPIAFPTSITTTVTISTSTTENKETQNETTTRTSFSADNTALSLTSARTTTLASASASPDEVDRVMIYGVALGSVVLTVAVGVTISIRRKRATWHKKRSKTKPGPEQLDTEPPDARHAWEEGGAENMEHDEMGSSAEAKPYQEAHSYFCDISAGSAQDMGHDDTSPRPPMSPTSSSFVTLEEDVAPPPPPPGPPPPPPPPPPPETSSCHADHGHIVFHVAPEEELALPPPPRAPPFSTAGDVQLNQGQKVFPAATEEAMVVAPPPPAPPRPPSAQKGRGLRSDRGQTVVPGALEEREMHGEADGEETLTPSRLAKVITRPVSATSRSQTSSPESTRNRWNRSQSPVPPTLPRLRSDQSPPAPPLPPVPDTLPHLRSPMSPPPQPLPPSPLLHMLPKLRVEASSPQLFAPPPFYQKVAVDGSGIRSEPHVASLASSGSTGGRRKAQIIGVSPRAQPMVEPGPAQAVVKADMIIRKALQE